MRLPPPIRCTGCSACQAACPRRAIRMTPLAEDLGCLHPVVDASKCVECGACVRVCPVTKEHAPDFSPRCYAARTRDRELLKASSSGGVFSELSRLALAEGGCVFGCALRSLSARHVKVEDEAGLSELRGSKYVQSDLGDSLADCLTELKTGRSVLFSGTPCQIAGLRSFLGGDFDNLLCVGLICHGVASPLVFRQYLKEEESRLGGTITDVSFRNKVLRHGDLAFCLDYSRNGQDEAFVEDWANVYMRSFLNAYSYRECCFDCAFRSGRCGADIVLGDFWGVESIDKSYSTTEGASAVLVYTAKGAEAFGRLTVDSFQTSYADISRRNANLDGNAKRPEARTLFAKAVLQGGGVYPFFKRLDAVPLHRQIAKRFKGLLRPLYRRIRYGNNVTAT